MTAETHYDIFIIGGGINGCGLARDAAGRGYKVGLAEMYDLGSGTSSASTKLIHGGLRYLEQYAFHLVRESLIERDTLWHIAPHLIEPLRFLLPYHEGLRPAWMLRFGLFLYDHLGGHHDFPKAGSVDLKKIVSNPLKNSYEKGFIYSDARVDDARLVLANARDAHLRGAHIFTRTKVIAARPEDKGWRITLACQRTQKQWEISAAYIANMAGPWINSLLQDVFGYEGPPPVRLVQGSHIIVPALYEHNYAYIFQNPDGRIIFAIPYQEDFTLIGTTDQDYQGPLDTITITDKEVEYLCEAASEYFSKPVTSSDIVASYSGVRPLYNDGSAKAQEATRDYILKEMRIGHSAPFLNSFGGKITTYRRLSEDAMGYIEQALGKHKPSWTAQVCLPGGDFSHREFERLLSSIRSFLPQLSAKTHKRLAHAYGTDTFKIFSNIFTSGLGEDFGHELFEPEVMWMIEKEWAQTAEDVLWRRSKLGLVFNREQIKRLELFLQRKSSPLQENRQ